jgi:hypothetical protein
MDEQAAQLRDRIWNTFPVAQPAFAKLLSLLEIEVSREVPTAAVTLGPRSRLRINPDFAAAHCADDPALVMLVLHELFHVVLGHTRLYQRSTPTLNLAFDAVINAQLCLLLPGPEWTRLFRDLYPSQDPPWSLLRPPEGWRTPAERWLPGAIGSLHRRLYTDESISYEDLFRLLAEQLAAVAGGRGGLLGDGDGPAEAGAPKALSGGHDDDGAEPLDPDLLGSHGEDQAEPLDPDLLAEIREIIAGWPEVEQRSGRDQGSAPRGFRMERRERQLAAVAILRQALRNLRDQGGDGTGKPRIEITEAPGVFPHRNGGDRRAAVLEACGAEPLLFAGELPRRSFSRGERVHVYLDVSGSMEGLIAPLYAALAQLSGWMTPMLHLFSTVVKDITQDDLRRGVGSTTGGTSIAVVTEHMVRHGVRRALVVTDGWVGGVPTEHAHALARRKGRFGIALTAGGDPDFAQALNARVWNLPILHQETS